MKFNQFFIKVISVIIAAAIMATGAFADSGKSNKGGKKNAESSIGQQEKPNGKTKSSGNSNGQQQKANGKTNPGQNMRQGNGVRQKAISLIKEKIDGLEGTATKKALTELLEDYEAAVAAEKAVKGNVANKKEVLLALQQETAEARVALAVALTDAGIEILGDKPVLGNGPKTPLGKGFIKGLIDTEAVADIITEIYDSATQATLSKLLKAYETARAAEKAGLSDSKITKDERVALREATITACNSLVSALDDADIKRSEYTKNPKVVPPDSESSEDKAMSGIFQGILKWISGWNNEGDFV